MSNRKPAKEEVPEYAEEIPAYAVEEIPDYAIEDVTPAEEKPWYDVSAESLTKSSIEALPTIGGGIGGALGFASPIPGGAMIGAGSGAYIGKSLQNSLESLLYNKNNPNPWLSPLEEGLKNSVFEGAGQLTAKALSKILSGAGSWLYKRGLKKLDVENIAKNQDPVSDLFLEKGIWGGNAKIEKKAEEIADQLLQERNILLQDAANKGIEVSMKDSMKAARARLAELRSLGDPDSVRIADTFEKRIRSIEAMDAVEPKQITRKLPIQGEFRGARPGDSDYIPPTFGELPTQGKVLEPGYKQGKKIGEKVTENYVELPVPSRFTKGDVVKTTPGGVNYIELPKQARYTTGDVKKVTPGGVDYIELPHGNPNSHYEFPKVPKKPEIAAEKLSDVVEYGPKGYVQNPPEIGVEKLEDIVEYGPRGYVQNPPGASKVVDKVDEFADATRTPELFQEGQRVPITVENPANDSTRFYQKPEEVVLDETERIPGVTPSRATKLKTYITKSIPNSKFAEAAQTSQGQDLVKLMGRGLKEQTEAALNAGSKSGTGDVLADLNERLGRILTSKKAMNKAVIKEGADKTLTGWDAGVAAFDPKFVILKKGIESIGTGAKTGMGLGMYKIGHKLAPKPRPGYEGVFDESPWSRLLIELNRQALGE